MFRSSTPPGARSRGASLPIQALFALLLLSADSAYAAGAPSIPTTHIIMADREGGPVDPVHLAALDPKHLAGYVDDLFLDLGKTCAKNESEKKRCKVLFYFHGGMNTRRGTVDRATQLTEPILKSGSYPIFVNWRSSLVSSWWDHVAHISKGFYVKGPRPILAPYVVAVDEVKSVADTLTDWWAEGRHTFPWNQAAGKLGLDSFQELTSRRKNHVEPSVDVNPALLDPSQSTPERPRLVDHRSFGDRWIKRLTVIPTLPTKLLAPPLLIQAAGTGAWSVMQRRVALLFRTEAEFRGAGLDALKRAREAKLSGATKPPTGGKGADPSSEEAVVQEYDTGAALAYFINRFQSDFLPYYCARGSYARLPDRTASAYVDPEEGAATEAQKKLAACAHPVEVTLVGHSMGSLIIDELLRYRPDLEVKNIVFMAGATSLGDYRDTIHPYLKAHPGQKGDPSSGTQMYHLVLHPLAETTEWGFLDLSPRGSLLVWIDNYFTDPISPLERRVGRFSNLVPELALADGVSGQIHLKVFQVGKKVAEWNPQKHTDFGKFPFWDERFWNPATPTEEGKGEGPVARYPLCEPGKGGKGASLESGRNRPASGP